MNARVWLFRDRKTFFVGSCNFFFLISIFSLKNLLVWLRCQFSIWFGLFLSLVANARGLFLPCFFMVWTWLERCNSNTYLQTNACEQLEWYWNGYRSLHGTLSFYACWLVLYWNGTCLILRQSIRNLECIISMHSLFFISVCPFPLKTCKCLWSFFNSSIYGPFFFWQKWAVVLMKA